MPEIWVDCNEDPIKKNDEVYLFDWEDFGRVISLRTPDSRDGLQGVPIPQPATIEIEMWDDDTEQHYQFLVSATVHIDDMYKFEGAELRDK